MSKTVTHKGRCHCAAVSFEFTAPPTLSVTVCNCSICHMTGYQHIMVKQSDVYISGAQNLSSYTFGTHTAQHLFCKTCGIKPLYIPRSHPDCYSINLRCVEGETLNPEEKIQFDGQNWERNIDALKDSF